MTKRISTLESSLEIYLTRRISSNSETVGIYTFFEAPSIGYLKTKFDVTKVIYDMYSYDTCYMSREMMEMDDRDLATCQNPRVGTCLAFLNC